MFKKISIGLGACMLAFTAFTLAVPQKAEARYCKVTYIPHGFQATSTPCGSPGCSGLIYTHQAFGSMCVITDTTI